MAPLSERGMIAQNIITTGAMARSARVTVA